MCILLLTVVVLWLLCLCFTCMSGLWGGLQFGVPWHDDWFVLPVPWLLVCFCGCLAYLFVLC